MGSLKNILIHCQKNENDYELFGAKPDDCNRLINRGWIEALQFVEEHFDVDFNTIEQKGK